MKKYCCDGLRDAEYYYISYFDDKRMEDCISGCKLSGTGWGIEGMNGVGDIFPAHFMTYCPFCGKKIKVK